MHLLYFRHVALFQNQIVLIWSAIENGGQFLHFSSHVKISERIGEMSESKGRPQSFTSAAGCRWMF